MHTALPLHTGFASQLRHTELKIQQTFKGKCSQTCPCLGLEKDFIFIILDSKQISSFSGTQTQLLSLESIYHVNTLEKILQDEAVNVSVKKMCRNARNLCKTASHQYFSKTIVQNPIQK